MNSRAEKSTSSTVFSPSGAAPDLTALARSNSARYPYLLESAAAGSELASYDILFAYPGETLRLDGAGEVSGPHSVAQSFLSSLDNWWLAERDNDRSDGLPFCGGWFLFLGYELAGEVEPSLRLTHDPELPVAFATRIPVAVIREHPGGKITVVAEEGYADRIPQVIEDLEAACLQPATDTALNIARINEDDPALFIEAVRKAQEYIAAGDIFQANLSRCWRISLNTETHPVDLYKRLRAANPSPFAGLIQHDDFALLSSSPERLVRRLGMRLDTRPIAGTRPRLEGPDEADEQKQALLDNPKERAEHVMLIDLERNDLGRVCEGGTVQVDEFMAVESYSHVHHIVSNVTGIAREGLLPGELVRAVFPGGTITGCPKVRCMEIIHELEQRPRGAYTGSIGYLNRNGDCDLNILIRTMCLRGSEIEIAAGSGIVADSDPQAELDETRAKAKGLLLALQDERDAAA